MKRLYGSILFVCGLTACGDKASSSGGDSSTPSGSGAPSSKAAATSGGTAAAKPARAAKTKLTQKQLKEIYDTVTKEMDFQKHRALYEDKLGKPMKEDGDKAYWWGIQPAEGAQPEACYEVYTSPTKGDSAGDASETNCWDK